MLVGAVEAEVDAGSEGNMLGFQEVRTEGLRVLGECADVGIQIERALWLDGDVEAQCAQCRQQVIAALLELGAARFEDGDALGREAGQGRMLGDGRGADVEVLREFSNSGTAEGGAISQPRRQPVMPKYLEKLFSTNALSSTSSTLCASRP